MAGSAPATPPDWPCDLDGARAMQRALAPRVRLDNETADVATIAGVDTGFENHGTIARACVALFDWPELTPQGSVIGRASVAFPYIPGFLSFREMPAVLAAMERLPRLPDLLLCDGQGVAHPRRFGIAAHLGIWLDRPAIGVGKSRLCGDHEPVGNDKGDTEPLCDQGERIGTVVRSRTGVKPLYVSPGHRVDHTAAVRWVLACTGRFRLPEPIRAADHAASRR